MLALAAIQARTTLAPEAFRNARARLERPTPRVALGQALRGIASAMIDVSDGLTGDLAHVLEASGTGARIELAQVPRSLAMGAKLTGPERALALACLLAGGDDYELLFTAREDRRAQVTALSTTTEVPLTRIGTIVGASEGLVIVDESGDPLPALPRAFDHFA
jgi:thiamine-monophosphate kinase